MAVFRKTHRSPEFINPLLIGNGNFFWKKGEVMTVKNHAEAAQKSGKIKSLIVLYLLLFTVIMIFLFASCGAPPLGTGALKVSYSNNNPDAAGSAPIDNKLYNKNTLVTVLDNGTLTIFNSNFEGWRTAEDATGTLYQSGSTFSITVDTELFASWEEPGFKIIYNSNGSDFGIVPEDTSRYLSGVTATIIETPPAIHKVGQGFKCWTTDQLGNGTEYFPGSTITIGNSHITLYAQFETRKNGSIKTYTIDGVSFNMINMESKKIFKHYTPEDPTNPNYYLDLGYNLFMCETEITFELWEKVIIWANANGYTIPNPGMPGPYGNVTANASKQIPVVGITIRDTIVWCNAFTEYVNSLYGTSFAPAYCQDAAFTLPFKVAPTHSYNLLDGVIRPRGEIDNPYINYEADGFRMPTDDETTLAMRYIGDFNNDGDLFDEGEAYPQMQYVSGADTNTAVDNPATVDFDGDGDLDIYTDVGIFDANAPIHPTLGRKIMAEVKSKKPNKLGFYDLSGNAGEFIFQTPTVYDTFVQMTTNSSDYTDNTAVDLAQSNLDRRILTTGVLRDRSDATIGISFRLIQRVE